MNRISQLRAKRSNGGFTLVEIAIVLIIIGLIIAGILKGQEAIDSGKAKRVKTDVDTLVAITQTYLDNFGYYPGDDPNADDRFTVIAAGQNGDGLGTIGAGTADNTDTTGETVGFWQHIIAAGLVSGDDACDTEQECGKQTPFAGSYYRVRYDNTDGIATPDIYQGKHYFVVERIPRKIARTLEDKYDQGSKIQADGGAPEATGFIVGSPDTTDTNYYDTDGAPAALRFYFLD